MKYHIIACGGSIMHQLTIQLARLGNEVSGSDDEIFEPALSNLQKHGLLPATQGWDANRIDASIDAIIVGMHAKSDNPELLKAKELGIKLYSYPEFIYEHSKNKKRVAIAGSHGKTSTTAMVMHVLKSNGVAFDYLVGAKLEGFDYSLQISDAPIIILEADEYPDSAQNKLPKFLFYHPHIASISGIAWDHVNIFTTFDDYLLQFEKFVSSIEPNGVLIYNEEDVYLQKISSENPALSKIIPFGPHPHHIKEDKVALQSEEGETVLQIFGRHNLFNLNAAFLICKELGISNSQFYSAIASFKGAAKRLQLVRSTPTNDLYLDFAHAPSKVKATVEAMKELHPKRQLMAVLELHTFSSLNENFITEYKGALDAAEFPIVFYDAHSFELKRLPIIAPNKIIQAFGNNEIKTFTNAQQMTTFMKRA
jgi:UDP-N-acetylmuramate: L-alanyl-gamma-D-glutamyl-meso-diaminopimelate ligase